MKTRTDPRDEGVLGKLSNRTRRIIEAIARSPYADKAVADEEKATIARRSVLGAELQRLRSTPIDHRLVSAVHAARADIEKAEQALQAARQKHRDADVILSTAQLDAERRHASVLQELHETADDRLWQFIAKLRGIITHDLSLAIELSIETNRNVLGHIERSYRTNVDALTRAEKACQRVISAADASRLEALDYVEVSQRLMAWCEELAGPLGAVKVNPPSLTAEFAEVGPNAPWSGSPNWIVEQPFRQTRREYLDRISVEIKQKTKVPA